MADILRHMLAVDSIVSTSALPWILIPFEAEHVQAMRCNVSLWRQHRCLSRWVVLPLPIPTVIKNCLRQIHIRSTYTYTDRKIANHRVRVSMNTT